MEIKKELTKVFSEVFNNPSINISKETTSNDVVGWESFSHMNFIFAIEIHFNIEFTQFEATSFTNVGELMNSIERKFNKTSNDNLLNPATVFKSSTHSCI